MMNPTPSRRRPRIKPSASLRTTNTNNIKNKTRWKVSQRSLVHLLLLIPCTLYVVPHYIVWKKTLQSRAAAATTTTAQQQKNDFKSNHNSDQHRTTEPAQAITKKTDPNNQPTQHHDEYEEIVDGHHAPRISDDNNRSKIAAKEADVNNNVVPVGEFPFYRAKHQHATSQSKNQTVPEQALSQFKQSFASNTTTSTESALLSSPRVQQHTCHDGTRWITMPQAPDFIIAGTQKGGTTALYALLRKHPHIVPSALFEAHFFDMHYGSLRQQLEKQNYHGDALHCQLRKAYVERLSLESLVMEKLGNSTQMTKTTSGNSSNQSIDSNTAPTLLTFEKTPNYMIWPHVPAAIVETCPWKPKVIVILRNPVDRLYSQYQMQFVMSNNVPNLETVLEQELIMLRKFGLSQAPPPPNVTTASGANTTTTTTSSTTDNRGEGSDAALPLLTYTFRPPPIESKERDAKDSIRFRGFGNHGSYHRYLQRGMYVYQLQRFLAQRPQLELLVVPYERMRNDTEAVWHEILDFVGAPPYNLTAAALRATYRPSIDHDNRHEMPPAAPLNNATRAYLVEFYRPYNNLLADLLGEEWRGIWDV